MRLRGLPAPDLRKIAEARFRAFAALLLPETATRAVSEASTEDETMYVTA